MLVYKRRNIPKLASKGKIQGHTSGKIDVSSTGSKPPLASTVNQIDEVSRLKLDLVNEVPPNRQSISKTPLSPKNLQNPNAKWVFFNSFFFF
jgi:hypothetical protein